MFRFVPKRRVRNMLNYCLRVTAAAFEGKIELHEFMFMSNHLHLLLTDVGGVLPRFMRSLDSLISRNLNPIRGLTGKNFEGYSSQVIDPDDHDRLVQAAVYVLCNPCQAHLVSRSRHWKGTSSLRLRYGEPSVVKQPADGMYASKLAHLRGGKSTRSGRASYAGRSKAPAEAGLILHRLPGFGRRELSDDKVRSLVLARLDAEERRLIAQRRSTGSSVLGWRHVEAAHFNQLPSKSRELFDRSPTYAASTPERRERAQHRRESFLRHYYEALDSFIAGVRDAVFPHGTWLMVQRYNVRCHPAAP